jgi:large subunit ribosomal protein L15
VVKLSDLKMPKGANKDRKRVGRGHGSGYVKTAGRGQKGQKARAGGNVHPRFEGGQTPIQQQLPYKRGFTNIWKARYNLVNLDQLERAENIEAGAQLNPERLVELGFARYASLPIKVLGSGDLSRALHITAHKVSEGARQKIEAAGGSVTLIETTQQPRPARGHTQHPVRRAAERAAARGDNGEGGNNK